MTVGLDDFGKRKRRTLRRARAIQRMFKEKSIDSNIWTLADCTVTLLFTSGQNIDDLIEKLYTQYEDMHSVCAGTHNQARTLTVCFHPSCNEGLG